VRPARQWKKLLILTATARTPPAKGGSVRISAVCYEAFGIVFG